MFLWRLILNLRTLLKFILPFVSLVLNLKTPEEPSKFSSRRAYHPEKQSKFSFYINKKNFLDKASSHQHKTIGSHKPFSILSKQSFGLPTSYYEHTTPYISKQSFDLHYQQKEDLIEENEVVHDVDLSDEEINLDDNTFGNFDEQINTKDFVEAYNPNVKVNENNKHKQILIDK